MTLYEYGIDTPPGRLSYVVPSRVLLSVPVTADIAWFYRDLKSRNHDLSTGTIKFEGHLVPFSYIREPGAKIVSYKYAY